MSESNNQSPHTDWCKKVIFSSPPREPRTRPEVIYAAFKYLFPEGGFHDPKGKKCTPKAKLKRIKELVEFEVGNARQKLPPRGRNEVKSDPVEATKFMVEIYSKHLSANAEPSTYHLVVIYNIAIKYVERKLNKTFNDFLSDSMPLLRRFLECSEELVVKMKPGFGDLSMLDVLNKAHAQGVSLEHDYETYRLVAEVLSKDKV